MLYKINIPTSPLFGKLNIFIIYNSTIKVILTIINNTCTEVKSYINLFLYIFGVTTHVQDLGDKPQKILGGMTLLLYFYGLSPKSPKNLKPKLYTIIITVLKLRFSKRELRVEEIEYDNWKRRKILESSY